MKNEHVEKNYDGYRSLPDDILTGRHSKREWTLKEV